MLKIYKFQKMKRIYVLVGPPSVGKSTWIKNTFVDTQPYVINRDVLVEKVAEEFGWTYDDMFTKPPIDADLGDTNEKYGEVVKAPSSMSWPGSPKIAYSKVVEYNRLVQLLFDQRVTDAKGQEIIIVDMTNMGEGSRRSALRAIQGREYEYEKIAVVFPFKGFEETIKKVAQKRSDEAKKIGKSKTIPAEVMDRMFQNYQEVSPEEGFDKIIIQDNSRELKKLISDEQVEESKVELKHLKKFSMLNNTKFKF